MKLRIFLIVSIFFGLINAQEVKEIRYDGLAHMTKSVADRLVGFKVGNEISQDNIDSAIKKFFKQSYFKDIWVTNEDGVITFFFKEKEVISKIELEGYKEDDEDVKKSVLKLDRGSLYDEKKVEAAKQRIIEALNADGKIDSVVEVEVEHLESGSVALTFKVNEGEEIIIEEMQFSGLKGLEDDEFDSMIANKEHQFMGWMWGRNDGVMKLDQLQYDPHRIKDVYMQHGYMDASVDAPFSRVDFDNYSAQLSYQIYEGEIYRVSTISVSLDTPVIEKEELQKEIALEINEPFNIKTFRDDAEKIKTKVADLGYAFVQVEPDLQKNKENKTVDVSYRVTPGNKVYIRNVIVNGNNRTLDRIIRRQIYLAPGDLYSLTDLKESRNALQRTGFFDDTTVEEKRIDENRVDIIVKVTEAPTGNIQVGGGYGSYGGVLLNLAVNDRNIFGSGINMGVNLEKSEVSNNYSFNISNPKLNDSDFSGNFSIFTSEYEYYAYSVQSDGLTLGSGHQFTRYISGYLGYGYSQNRYSDVDYNLSNYYNIGLYNPFESYAKSSVTLSVSYDSTDDYYLPRNGISAVQSVEKAGVGGEADFVKSVTRFSTYKGIEDIVDFDMILRYKARYFHLIETGYLPIAEKFYMGGLSSVRGYESSSLPNAQPDANGRIYSLGGMKTFSNSIEANVPLVPAAKMRLTGFVDYGYIGENSLSEIDRGGYGMGIEWFSPVGPVQLVFARPINEQAGDRTAFFEFSMGQRF